MNKFLLMLITLVGVYYNAQAKTFMCIKTENGNVARYHVDCVKEVYYKNDVNDSTSILLCVKMHTDDWDSYKMDLVSEVYYEEQADTIVTVSGEVDTYPYVDLFLRDGTKWATYNIGANDPADYGNYYAWGETEPKSSYDSDNYKLSRKYIARTCSYVTHGGVFYQNCNDNADNLSTLLKEDDAANINWGSNWKMPSAAQLGNLEDGCIWTWTDDYNGSGVAGCIGTSKRNSNVIFLPAVGYQENVNVEDFGTNLYYWANSCFDWLNIGFIPQHFEADNMGKTAVTGTPGTIISRSVGLPVRAVVVK